MARIKDLAIDRLNATDSGTYGKRAIAACLVRARACNAPIGPLENKKRQWWHLSPMGQTHAPAKVLKDLRTGRRISLTQAWQILAKFERKQAKKEH